MNPQINLGYDYLAIRIDATGVSSCTQPLYQFAYYDWGTSTRTIFRDYDSKSYAYWDTRNFYGTQYISIYVKDATSFNAYDTYSPWIAYNVNSHGYGDTFDPHVSGLYLQNIDPQGRPENTIGPDPQTGNVRLTKWLSTYITLDPTNNILATSGTPACNGAGNIYAWQGAYAAGVAGDTSLGAFVQTGWDYSCSGVPPYAFATAITKSAVSCPVNGTSFPATVSAEYKTCYTLASALGVSPGSTANFDMHSVGFTFYMGVNGRAILSVGESIEGLQAPYLDTELAYLNVGVGDHMNSGMAVRTSITASYAYNHVTSAWFQLPNNTTNQAYASWYTAVFRYGTGSVGGTGVYCDRPFGYFPAWNGNSSSYAFWQGQFGRCG